MVGSKARYLKLPRPYYCRVEVVVNCSCDKDTITKKISPRKLLGDILSFKNKRKLKSASRHSGNDKNNIQYPEYC